MASTTSAPGAAALFRNWLYQYHDGFLFAGRGLSSRRTARHPIALLLTTAQEPFEVDTGRRRIRCRAAVVGSLVARRLEAEGMPLVSANIQPEHALFCALNKEVGPTIRPLDWSVFEHLAPQLARAVHSELTLADARALFDALVASLARQLAVDASERADAQAMHLRALVQRNPDITLAELARELGLSYSRASALFTRTVGLSMRSYRLWRKAARAWAAMGSGRTLTEIAVGAGFCDSAHFSRQWQQWFGVAPSAVCSRRVVRVRYQAPLRSAATGK